MRKATHPTLSLATALVVVLSGCGYFLGGTWEDDPNNWSRAFDADKPADVVVLHSKYWRSAHWTLEYAYYFEIVPNSDFRNQLFAKNRLRQLVGNEAAAVKSDLFGDAPAWFIPKAIEEYDVWVSQDDARSNFKLLIDKATGTIYLNDFLV